MNVTKLQTQIEGLRHMTVGQLKEQYRALFNEESRSNHKQFLFRRVAWRIQANAEGGLSERARQRALEIANDADLRIRAPRNFLKASPDTSTTFELVQGRLKQNCTHGSPAHRTKMESLLRGLIYCTGCGAPMYQTYTSSKGRRYRYYICSRA